MEKIKDAYLNVGAIDKEKRTPKMKAKYLPGEKGGFQVTREHLHVISIDTLGYVICGCGMRVTPGEVIRAVNAHEELLRVAKMAKDKLANHPDGAFWQLLESTIAKAEGE